MEVLENELLKIEVNLYGGTLHSIVDKSNNFELQYQVIEGSWPFQDVVIFPLIGQSDYEYESKKYHISTRHGFLRTMNFVVAEKGENFLSIEFKSTPESLLLYPFNFKFNLTYILDGYKIIEKVKVTNLENDKLMPFMYGSHLGLKANENTIIRLSEANNPYPLDDKGLIDLNKKVDFCGVKDIDKSYIAKLDTIVFNNNSSHLEVLNGYGYSIKYTFDSPYFALWSNTKKGDFLCVEPWWGISNYVNQSENILGKEAINLIKKEKDFSFSIEFRKL